MSERLGPDELLPDEARRARRRAPAARRPGRARRPRRDGRPRPRSPRARARPALRPSSESMRACSSAWIVGGTASRRRRCCSRTIATISSTKSGVPGRGSRDALARVDGRARARRAGCRSAPRTRSAPSGSSRSDVALSLPPPQPGRASSSSVRATQRRKIGASRERSATCSTRSRNTGSAHWRSSIDDDLRALGRTGLEQLAERDPRLLRRRSDDALGLDAERREHLDERPVRDALAVGEAAAAEDVGRVARRARGSPRRAATCRCPRARAA